jgi:pantetheine-phosphate adenylyltransferase
MERKALYAGSFDPLTNGHLNLIERAAKMYDSLTVAIAVNPNKTGFFTVEERVEIAKEVTKHLPNVTVDAFGGLLAEYINTNEFTAYVRGLRSTADFENELMMAQMNTRLFTSGTEVVFLMTDPQYSFISSSMIKEVASLGGSIDGLVPEYVAKKMEEKLG